MNTTPISPKLIKGGIVLVHPDTSLVERFIPLQYNPETLSRSYQVEESSAGDGGDRSQALRLTGPPIEVIKVEALIDAIDLLEEGDSDAVEFGIHRELAALESLLYPSSQSIQKNHERANSGVLEIIPMESLLTVFVWSEQRVFPFKLTELSVTEETFDVALNPLRARVSFGMRVLSVNDLGFSHKGGSLFMAHLQRKEALRDKSLVTQFNSLGIGDTL